MQTFWDGAFWSPNRPQQTSVNIHTFICPISSVLFEECTHNSQHKTGAWPHTFSSYGTTAKTTQKKIADPPITDEKAKIKALGRIPKKKTMNSSPNSDSKYALELTADDPIEAPTVNDHPDNNFQPLGDTIRENRNKKDDIHKILERKLEEEGIEGAKNNHADHNNESSRMEIDEIEIDIVEEIKVKTEVILVSKDKYT